jgi:hypothetical protein
MSICFHTNTIRYTLCDHYSRHKIISNGVNVLMVLYRNEEVIQH